MAKKVTFEAGGRGYEELYEEIVPVIERELLAELDDDKLDDDDRPSTYEWGDTLVWAPSRQDPSGRDLPDDLPVSQVVEASWGDLGTATVWVYRRFDGEFVKVDEYVADVAGDDQVRDYVLFNYGTDVKVRYKRGGTDPFSDDVDGRYPWISERVVDLPADDERRAAVEWMLGRASGSPGSEALRSVVEADEFFHLAARVLGDSTIEPTEEDFAALESDDPAARSRAVRRIAALGTLEPDRYRQFVEAIPRADETTQRLVAPLLWEPPELDRAGLPDLGLVSPLAGLVQEADAPEARVAGLMGAARIVCETFVPEYVDEGMQEVYPDDEVDPDRRAAALTDLYEALAVAFRDDDPMVLARAAEVPSDPLACAVMPDEWVAVCREKVAPAATFEARWEMACAAAALTVESDGEVHARLTNDDRADRLFFDVAFDGDPETLPTLVAYAWDEAGPRHGAVRAIVADHAAEAPEEVAEYVDRPVAAVQDGTATAADIRLLSALAETDPEAVAGVADELVAMLAEGALPEPIAESKPSVRSDPPVETATALERALVALADREPARVRAAVETHYADPTAFLGANRTDEREEIVARLDGT